ncbi:PREDICTED: uncharacterized protein LOC108970385 [Bactrocera latifrons]|uniref:uncharacterized protein LOC108970385 n=1 Tax=Bactrocera latifrons TaxID=174628 RepID=UPI0008DCA02B|nr:PREDICTED: uncharacterized protein LOC108970385 [Bactrocera latifrons]
MKLYLLTVFAVLVLLVLPSAANAEGQNATEEPPPSNPTSPPRPGPGPFRPGSGPFRPGPFQPFFPIRRFPFPPFNITGNFSGRPFFPFSVYSDDDVSSSVQDGDVKAQLVREPRVASFDSLVNW